MTQTKKFSQFNGPDPIQSGDIVAGLRNGENWQFTGVGSGGGGGDAIIREIEQDPTDPGNLIEVGDWVRIDSSGDYTAAQANTAENAEVLGVVIALDGSTSFTLQELGYIADTSGVFSGLSQGAVYFLSDSSVGDMTITQPTQNGFVTKPVFVAETATSGWVVQYRGMIIGTPGPIPSSSGGGSDTSTHQVSQPGNTFNAGDFVRVGADNVFALANGQSLASSQAIGVVTIAGDPLFTIQQSGFLSGGVITQAYDSAGSPIAVAAATVYYLSDVVGREGQITPTAPTATGSATRPVFISQSAIDETGWLFPQRPLLNASDTADPSIVTVNQTAHGFIRGEVLYISATNTYAKAIANNEATARAVGFVREVIDVDNFILQTSGYASIFSAPFTPLVTPNQYWLSDATPGAITNVEPTTVGNYSKPMLQALNTTTGYILEQREKIIPSSSGGAIIQVVSFVTGAVGAPIVAPATPLFTEIPLFNATITPASITNLIKVTVMLSGKSNARDGALLLRNGLAIPGARGIGGNLQSSAALPGDNTGSPIFIQYIDSPASVAAQTYSIGLTQFPPIAGSFTLNQSTPSLGIFETMISSIILEEIEVP